MNSSKHLLIALGEHQASSQALSYGAVLFACDPQVTYHLLHCHVYDASSIIPEPLDNKTTLIPDSQFRSQDRRLHELILARGAQLLEDKGVSSQQISTFTVSSSQNPARAIMIEAERLLSDCIVIARRGLGYVGEIVMGSVSATLFRNSHTTPLWIIDGEVTKRNIFVAVDGSVYSLRAIDHLAHILKDRHDIKIFLYHCSAFLAPSVVCSLERFVQEWNEDWCKTYLSGDGCLFNGPAQMLREAGIPAENIVILPETKTIEESTSIVSQAKKHDCGTIVIGRRGPEVRKGFFGGVSNRTIRQTQNMAVWIIG
jgi:nucleotide-binding universal stress UspA family protein